MRAVKEMIYELMSMKLYEMYMELDANNIEPIGVKTDAILVRESHDILKSLFNADDVIGGYKFESNKTCVNFKIMQRKVDFFKNMFIEFKVNKIEMKDEYDIKEMQEIYEKYPNIIALGEYPGVGKTSSITNVQKETKINLCFVTPFNKLAQALRQSSKNICITLDKLLGTRPNCETKSLPYDVSEFKMITFDEIGLQCPNRLKTIARYMERHKDIKFAATMDQDQLPPIEQLNNISEKNDVKKYHMECINQMFPNQLVLKTPKRVKTEKERQILYDLKKAIFSNTPMKEIISKFGFNTITNYSQLKTKRNICYFNFRTNIVNKYVHTNLIKPPPKTKVTNVEGTDYWPDLYVLCKEHYKKGGITLRKNYEYIITEIKANKKNPTFTVFEEEENSIFTFDLKMLPKYFGLPYANTCHAVQGLSIDEPMTIFDANTPYASREFVWTAITRATKLSNVTFYLHSEEEVSRLTGTKKKQYFEYKVQNYKSQDARSNRTYNIKEYITGEWIMKQAEQICHNRCPTCSAPFEIEILEPEYSLKSNITVDRINNTLAHIKSNCAISCLRCNVTKRDDGPGKALKTFEKKVIKQKILYEATDAFDAMFDM